jgi:hypothetical protein
MRLNFLRRGHIDRFADRVPGSVPPAKRQVDRWPAYQSRCVSALLHELLLRALRQKRPALEPLFYPLARRPSGDVLPDLETSRGFSSNSARRVPRPPTAQPSQPRSPANRPTQPKERSENSTPPGQPARRQAASAPPGATTRLIRFLASDFSSPVTCCYSSRHMVGRDGLSCSISIAFQEINPCRLRARGVGPAGL